MQADRPVPTPPPPPPRFAVLASPFRPFGLAGVAYGVVLMVAWLAVQAGIANDGALRAGWHGHEMLLGFAGAIACAIALTALPGWAGVAEVRGTVLGGLVALWGLARVAFWTAPALPMPVAVTGAAAPWIVLAALTARQVAGLSDRRWWLLPAVFAALAAASMLAAAGDVRRGLALATWALVLLFALAAGVFVPVFTRTHLRGRGVNVAPANAALDVAAITALIAVGALEVLGASPSPRAAAALAAGALHAVRLLRWQGWRTLDAPLLWTLHAGYAWFVLALFVLALGGAGVAGAQRAWLHAFTVGALGSTMLGLLTRVVLRHTGRPLVVAGPVRAVFVLVQAAALLRVAGAASAGGVGWTIAAGFAWAAAFALYLGSYAPFLVRPSLPRARSPLALDSRPRPDAC